MRRIRFLALVTLATCSIQNPFVFCLNAETMNEPIRMDSPQLTSKLVETLRNPQARTDEIVYEFVSDYPQYIPEILRTAIDERPDEAPNIAAAAVAANPFEVRYITYMVVTKSPRAAVEIFNLVILNVPNAIPEIAQAVVKGAPDKTDDIRTAAVAAAPEKANDINHAMSAAPFTEIRFTGSQSYPTTSTTTPPLSPSSPPGTPWGSAVGGGPSVLQLRKHSLLKVYFATDREINPKTKVDERYSGARGTVSYGACFVTVPKSHTIGELESPSVWRLTWGKDADKHVLLQEIIQKEATAFFSELKHSLNASRTHRALIFIHGYNVSFVDAARRTAQISYDLRFDGPSIFYSWPSVGKEVAYPTDETNVEWSEPNILKFLLQIVDSSDAKEIYLIAHSMGNRAVVRAVSELFALRPQAATKLKEIILAAPDIDADIFKRDIAPKITAISDGSMASSNVTLYVSSKDEALMLSKRFHSYPRIGDSGHGIPILAGIETVDTSKVNNDFLGHSYIAGNPSVIRDVYVLLHDKLRAPKRPTLRTIITPLGKYWSVKQFYPVDQNIP